MCRGRDRALRSRALLEMAERFETRAPELALMLTRENGKILAEATAEVGAPAATLRHSAAQTLTKVGTAAEVAPGHYSAAWPNRSVSSRSSCRGTHRWRCSSVP